MATVRAAARRGKCASAGRTATIVARRATSIRVARRSRRRGDHMGKLIIWLLSLLALAVVSYRVYTVRHERSIRPPVEYLAPRLPEPIISPAVETPAAPEIPVPDRDQKPVLRPNTVRNVPDRVRPAVKPTESPQPPRPKPRRVAPNGANGAIANAPSAKTCDTARWYAEHYSPAALKQLADVGLALGKITQADIEAGKKCLEKK